MLILTVVVKLFGGIWSLRRRIRTTRNRRLRHLLAVVYTAYFESHGAFIPVEADVDESVIFPHKPAGVFIAPGSRVGKNCVIYQQVTIGESRPTSTADRRAPTLGAGVLVGAGAKIIGEVVVGDGAKIGVNAVVIRDVPAGATVLAPEAVIHVRDSRART